MRIILVLFVAFLTTTSFSQEIKWMSFEEAQKAQKKEPRKIFVDAYTIWCGPCKMLDKNTFSSKDVANYINKNYYPVKFNAEGGQTEKYQGKVYTNPNFNPNTSGRNSSHQLSQVLGVRAYPTLIFLDEQANVIAPITGYKTPQQLELFLKFFKDIDPKTITQESWESYMASFKPTFK